jgi:hypothetical protein
MTLRWASATTDGQPLAYRSDNFDKHRQSEPRRAGTALQTARRDSSRQNQICKSERGPRPLISAGLAQILHRNCACISDRNVDRITELQP